MSKITVLGSGAWGTALAQVLTDNKNDVTIWGIDDNQINDINDNHRNQQFFKGIDINKTIKATKNLELALKDSEFVVIAIPSPFIKQVMKQVIPVLEKPVYFINVAKGFEATSKELMIPFLKSIIPAEKNKGIISLLGPTHAEEAILRNFTAIVATSYNEYASIIVQNLFSNQYFRVYVQEDYLGAELGAAIKNPIAIMSGILNGSGYGINSIAALLTRGLAEMSRIGSAFGAEAKTFVGLTGIGDLIVTGTSNLSRNFSFGIKLAQDRDIEKTMANNTKTVEGVFACRIIKEKLDNLSFVVQTPIINALYNILYLHHSIDEELIKLTNRTLNHE